jgi:hypothetical protein
MPVVAVTPTTITRPEELVEYLANLFQEQSEFDFGYIAKYDEKMYPKYPAIHIMAANFDKTLHSTATFLIGMRAAIHILHANMKEDRQTRNYEDLRLATQVVEFLESDMTLGGHVIHGFVENEVPGVLPPRVTKGDAVISTRLNWMGISQRRFK